MATIEIKRAHTLDRDEAKRRAEEFVRGMAHNLGMQWRWDGDLIRIDAPSGAARGATGTVSVDPGQVRVEVTVPLVLRALKGTIEAKINRKLDALIGP
jgi:putative polyhydroxyalkanoate system protein